tara:strand:- start:117 stop:377 length:261 start_codon:yes stop_codon:yes gene_type:complete
LDEKQQQTAFANDLEALIERYQNEFDMTFASMSGVLYCFATRTVLDAYMSRVAETVLEDYELVDEDEDEDDEDDEGDEWKSTDNSE